MSLSDGLVKSRSKHVVCTHAHVESRSQPERKGMIYISIRLPFKNLSQPILNHVNGNEQYRPFLESINARSVKIRLHRLRKLFPDIPRFTAMVIILACYSDSRTELRVLLIKPNSQNRSWGNT